MSFENYEERLNIILNGIKDKNRAYQEKYYPEVLNEKKIREELNSFVSNGPKTCREYTDLSYKFKKENEKKKQTTIKNDGIEEIEDFDEFLDKEVAIMYNQNWNKLDKLMKKNKLFEFINILKKENELNNQQSVEIKDMIMNEFEKNNLNKKSEVDYDKEKAIINGLCNLIISKENNEITFKFKEKKILKKKETIYKTKSELDKVITATKTLIKNT